MAGDRNESQTRTFSTTLPRALDTQIHVRVTTRSRCIQAFVTTTGADEAAGALAPLGSFVYAFPNKYQPADPLCTNIYANHASVEFAARLAKLIVRRTKRPVYVSSSLDVERMGLGGTVEEVLEAFQAVTSPLLQRLPQPPPLTNGDGGP